MIKKKPYIIIKLAGLLLASFFMLNGCNQNAGTLDSIDIDIKPDFSAIFLKGASSISKNQLPERLQVFLLSDSGTIRPDQSPLLGEYAQQNGTIEFTPAFSLARGQSYRARFNTGSQWLERDFYIKDVSRQSSAHIDQVYPSADELPLNVLKFYIQFTDSMARGFAYENLHFLTENGDTIPDVFLALSEELWSPDMKRFTLLLDPGRIKRGLSSKVELGYAFEQGLSYKLAIDKNWRDAHDQPLTRGIVKAFRVVDELRRHAGDFQLQEIPQAGTTQALAMKAPVPHDYALLHSAILLTDANGVAVSGTIQLDENERVWQFTPSSAWKKEQYQIRIGDFLEDIAGNNRINLFDVDNTVEQTTPRSAGLDYKTLSFSPK